MGYGRKWSDEEKEYITKITPGHHHSEIREMMISKFNKEYSLRQIKNAINRYKLRTGFDGRFKPGNIPSNKGIKGKCAEGCKKTWFKKGHKPQNHKPVGSERIDVDGYTLVKVAEPNKWELKHRLIYEKAKGKIPKGYSLIFADSDKSNFSLDNLLLVSRAELLKLNQEHLIKEDKDLTKTGLNVVKLNLKINELSK